MNRSSQDPQICTRCAKKKPIPIAFLYFFVFFVGGGSQMIHVDIFLFQMIDIEMFLPFLLPFISQIYVNVANAVASYSGT